MIKYLDDPAKWPILANKLRLAGEFGCDTETYAQPIRTSPQHRAKVHCWSVGLLTSSLSKKGNYREAIGFVLPIDALFNSDIRGVFNDPTITKWAHNAPHDYHSITNMGVTINGMQDSLQWFRVAFPGMSRYGLKSIAQWALHYEVRPSFTEMVTYNKPVITVKRKVERGCLCGKKGCKKRANRDFLSDWGDYLPHQRVTWRRFIPTSKIREFKYDVTDFTPTAKLEPLIWHDKAYNRWDEWLKYSAEDSTQGIEAVDWLRNQPKKRYINPWP